MPTAYNDSHDAPLDRFVRLPTVLGLTGKSTASIYRDMHEGTFPKPVVLGPNARAWRLSEIKAWQADRVRARDTGADAGLRAVNPNIGKGRRRTADDRAHHAA